MSEEKKYDFSIDDYTACDVFDAMNEAVDWTKCNFITGVVYDLVESAVADEVRTAESQIVRLYSHMLKFQYQPNKQTRSWLNTMDDSIDALNDIIGPRKNVQNKITEEELNKCYHRAVKKAVKETKMYAKDFPSTKPDDWTIDNIRDEKFIQEFIRKNKHTQIANEWYYRVYGEEG